MKLQQAMQTIRPSTRIFAAVALVATLTVTQARAADFWAIIANLNNSHVPQAQIDVSVDTSVSGGHPVPVMFEIFRWDGTLRSSFEVWTNPNGFTSSSFAAVPNDNLFNGSDGLLQLVRIHTPIGATSAEATLRETLGKAVFVTGLLRERRRDNSQAGAGKYLSIAIGDTAPDTTLFIANVSGADANVDVFLGTVSAPGAGKYNNPRLQNRTIWALPLDQSDANSHLTISSTADIVVQLAVVDGKKSPYGWQVLPF